MLNISERLARNPATLLKHELLHLYFQRLYISFNISKCVASCFGYMYVCTYNTPVSKIYITILLTKSLLLLLS